MDDDHRLAHWLAETAGQLALALRGGPLNGAALGYSGDQTANAFLMSALRALRPDDAILCEECPDELARLGASRVWIVDPLDGTREYAEGRDDWAVHVALVIGGAPKAGAVAVPSLGRVYDTATVQTAPTPARKPVMVVSRTRQPPEAAALAEHLGADLRPLGSAGAKAIAVVAGDADLYFHSGGQSEWDNCAPVAVALAAGLHASRADGSPIVYNQDHKLVPDLLIGRPDLAAEAVAFLGASSRR